MKLARQEQSPFGPALAPVVGYAWAAGGVAAATALFWLLRGYLDKGQASLLYLPVVMACAVRFGFGAAVLSALLSFLCWDFFFLPPFYTFAVQNSRDWLSLLVFLLAALVTARLASQVRGQAQDAQARERETLTLFQTSESISSEVEADQILPTLAEQVMQVCGSTRCLVLRCVAGTGALAIAAAVSEKPLSALDEQVITRLAETAAEHNQAIGFGTTRQLWARAAETLASGLASVSRDPGVFVPLQVQGKTVGVLHVGPRHDSSLFSPNHQRLILILSNQSAVVIARQTLAREAAQAVALREADTLKDALLSMVSHELRTPLAAIKAAASGLQQQGSVWEKTARDEAICSIDREADRLTGLVSNLLDLSRLEAGAWHPNKDWCDLAEIVGTALDSLPDDQAARVQVSIDSDLPLVRADYTQIALVLTNLLENAGKYTPSDTPIYLSATRSEPHTDMPADITLAVRDFGPGLVPGEQAHLFERFYRGQAHRDSTVHGTGLGLALCRAVVEAHGGCIWADNAADQGGGAVFAVSLPVDPARKGPGE